MAQVYLHAPQNFRNVCLFARTLEVLGLSQCYIFDPHTLIRERHGKSRSRIHRNISAGAFEKIAWIGITDPSRFLADYPGRLIATVADAEARPFTEFSFMPTDLLVFGSESHGLPPDVVASCGAAVTIPTWGQTQSLNLVVALGIVLFEAQRQLAGDNAHSSTLAASTSTRPGR